MCLKNHKSLFEIQEKKKKKIVLYPPNLNNFSRIIIIFLQQFKEAQDSREATRFKYENISVCYGFLLSLVAVPESMPKPFQKDNFVCKTTFRKTNEFLWIFFSSSYLEYFTYLRVDQVIPGY